MPVIAPDGCTPIGEPLEVPEPLPASADLIADALANDDIEYQESLVLRGYALLNDERLPKAYRSPVPALDDASGLFAEVVSQEADLSAETLAQLAPFMARRTIRPACSLPW